MKKLPVIIVALICTAGSLFAQNLAVDSVIVDSVWNSDSTWTNVSGAHSRISRDCRLRFIPAGGGTARCTVAVSFDNAVTWVRLRDTVVIINPMPGHLYPCAQKASVRIRFTGVDRPNIAFKVTARQSNPDVSVTPAGLLVGSPFTPPASGSDTTITVRCSINNTTLNRGSSPVAKVYWDTDGNGTFGDSGTDSLSRSFTSGPSNGTAGQQKLLVVKVRDANGLFSAPDTVVVQYGLHRPAAMVNISAGSFTMGNDSSRPNEIPAHQVTLSPFKIMTTEVTTELFYLLMGRSPFSAKDSALCPAREMSWYDAVLFSNALSKRMGLDTCYTYTDIRYTGAVCGTMFNQANVFSAPGYRLPTEAEWEYAARAGTTTPYYWGSTVDSAYCWYVSNSPDRSQPVAKKLPNSWGLYDMLGNVAEWVNDVFEGYTAGPQTNPMGGPAPGNLYGQRGGDAWDGFSLGDTAITVTFRDNGNAGLAYFYNGFRLAQKQ